MNVISIIEIIVFGIISGFLSVVGGGGSLLTMPLLIFLGLPSAVANGTNRIALLAQNIIAIINFKKKGYFDWKTGFFLAIPAAIGAVLGSEMAVSLSDELFNRILAVVMVIVLIFIVWNPGKKSRGNRERALTGRHSVIAFIAFFLVGMYGGFIQAGIGFIIIAILTVITGYSLVEINSIKVFVIAIYILSSLLVFGFNGKINWGYGIFLAIGNSIGAYLGSSFAVKVGDKWIKIILVVSVVLMAMKLIGVFG